MSNKIIQDIKGMHCKSCEIILEKNISKVPGVKKVSADFRKKSAEIYFDSRGVDYVGLEKAVVSAGYSLGKEEKKTFFSRNLVEYLELGAVASMMLAVYLVLKMFGFLNFSTGSAVASSLSGVFIIGLTAGVSSCMALIGGLVLGISARHAELHPEATAAQKFYPHLFFNLGRLASYAVLGGLIGALGSALRLSSSILGIITLVLGVLMLFLGLKLIEIFPRLSLINLTLPKSVSRIFGLHKETKEYSHKGSFVTGAVTFFVPCGLTQAMQIYAVSTGSFTQGSLIMFMFALGTAPGIIGVGGLTSVIKGEFARYFFKFAGIVVILLAVFNIRNGSTLAGYPISLPKFSGTVLQGDTDKTASKTASVQNGKQIIEMEQWGGGYRPNIFTVKKGVPVVWKVKSTTSYTCASYLIASRLGISGPLNLGMNTFEFTPTKVEDIRFSCSMGMYNGVIKVIN